MNDSWLSLTENYRIRDRQWHTEQSTIKEHSSYDQINESHNASYYPFLFYWNNNSYNQEENVLSFWKALKSKNSFELIKLLDVTVYSICAFIKFAFYVIPCTFTAHPRSSMPPHMASFNPKCPILSSSPRPPSLPALWVCQTGSRWFWTKERRCLKFTLTSADPQLGPDCCHGNQKPRYL